MEELTKDGTGVTGVDYYREILFRKLDTKSDVGVRATSFGGMKFGKVMVVGFDEFAIREPDGEVAKIRFEDILDIQ